MIRIQCDRDSMLMQLVSADAAGSCSAEATVRRLAGHPMCAGIGECGVDVVKHNLACMACRSMAERQLAVFKAQANIAGSQTFTRYAPDTVQGAASAWGLALQLGASFPQLSTQLSIPVVSSGAQSIGLQARESPRTHEDGLLSSRKSAPRLGKERRAASSSCARAQTQQRGKQGAWAEKTKGWPGPRAHARRTNSSSSPARAAHASSRWAR